MNKSDFNTYNKLNELAEQNGIVIFGCGEDKYIPTCELRQAFAIVPKVYNRSFDDLSIKNALSAYKENVTDLYAETVLIHIGASDLSFFNENTTAFDEKYRELIRYIKAQNNKCRIAVVSLKNRSGDVQIEKFNKHLKYIAESEQCEYGDIANKKVWNPKATMEASFFAYSIGFMHPLKNQCPIFDLVKIFFCYDD